MNRLVVNIGIGDSLLNWEVSVPVFSVIRGEGFPALHQSARWQYVSIHTCNINIYSVGVF